MSNKYKLLPNSKLIPVITRGNLCLFRKDECVNSNDKLVRIPFLDEAILIFPYNNYTEIEEFPTDKEDEVKLLVFEPFTDVTDVISSICNYKITSYHLNILTHTIYRENTYFSTVEPEKISSKYYLYENIINDPILINGDSNIVCLIEPKIEECLKITNPTINCFDENNNPSIYELEFDINDIERLHIFLKIDEEVKVYNIFYSEMKKGMPLTVYCPGDESEYLDIKTFYNRLLNHPLITEIKKETNLKEIDLKMTKQKIRKKAIDIFSNNK